MHEENFLSCLREDVEGRKAEIKEWKPEVAEVEVKMGKERWGEKRRQW